MAPKLIYMAQMTHVLTFVTAPTTTQKYLTFDRWRLESTSDGWSGPDVIVLQLLLQTNCSLVRFRQQNLVRE